MRAVNWLLKKVVKVRLQGPIDLQIQQKILQQLNQLTPSNAHALVLIINSYGGSLQVAKNIAHKLQHLQAKQIPVYCFAEEFCLNSANVILTASTQCFASKLSIIGDLGFVNEHYSFQEFTQKYKVGVEKIALHEPQIDTLGKNYQLNNPEFIKQWLADSANDLRAEVLANRREKVRNKGIQPQLFEQSIVQGGSLLPSEAERLGMIDGLQTCEQFIRSKLSGHRIKEEKEYKEYRAINFLRNTLEIFKQE